MRQIIQTLIATFAHAKTFGSLIQISPQRNADVRELLPIVQQALGRYSLDAAGLIYANAGNVGFDAGRYATFAADADADADADGILPLTDELWFDDDAASRVREFLLAVWGDGSGVVADADTGSPSPQPSPQRGEGVTAAGGRLDVSMAWLAEGKPAFTRSR